MDKNSVEVSLKDIESNLFEMSQKDQRVPAPFVFNVGETFDSV